MATAAQVRGMVLEEVILALLAMSGYRTVTGASRSDPTLTKGPSGLEIAGRATRHQIDAIADFKVPAPFAYPSRLLVEAKCYKPGNRVGLSVARNAVGVLKDASEWFDGRGPTRLRRWHYQYALFSATGFTAQADVYAFAHDIFPVTLDKVAAFRPILSAIRQLDSAGIQGPGSLSKARRTLRSLLAGTEAGVGSTHANPVGASVSRIASEFRRLQGALLGRLSSGLPIFLAPSQPGALEQIVGLQFVRAQIRYSSSEGWWLAVDGERIFDFDIPPELFRAHDSAGMFRAGPALTFKLKQFRELTTIYAPPGEPPRFIIFQLDEDWVSRVRAQISTGDSRGLE